MALYAEDLRRWARTDRPAQSDHVTGADGWGFIWVCLKMVSTPKPNGFADHYPYEKLLFH